MPIYEDEKINQYQLLELRKWNRCAQCGGMLNVFLDADKGLAYLACNTDQSHQGIVREASQYEQKGMEALNIPTRRKIMEQQYGKETSTAMEKYHGVTSLTKEQAKEILQTVYPKAPLVEMQRAVLLCASYSLNPLMGHVFLIPFKGKEGTTYATVIGIKAKRLLASRRHPFSYLDNSPRLMTEDEQKIIFGKVDDEHIVAITILKDPATGAEARGYGKWKKSEAVYGTEKGNSAENMAFIRSESQALDRLCPGEMPVGIEVMPEEAAEAATKEGVIEGEFKEVAEEKPKVAKKPRAKAVEESETEPTPEPTPEPEPEVKAEPASAWIPKTQDELFDWIATGMGWKTTEPVKSWLVNKCKIPEEKLDTDLLGVFYEVKALMGWN